MEESVNTEVLDKAMISNSSSEMFVCLLACVAHIINMLKSISDYIYIYIYTMGHVNINSHQHNLWLMNISV